MFLFGLALDRFWNFNMNTNFYMQDCKPKLFDLLLFNEVKMLKEQLTMSSSYVDSYFSLRGNSFECIDLILKR